MLLNLIFKQPKLYFGLAILLSVIVWLTVAASSTAPCAWPVWLGNNPLQAAQQGTGPASDYAHIGLWQKASVSAVQNQPPALAFLQDDDPTYFLTLEFTTQKKPLTAWRYGWVACPFVVDMGGPPLGK
ncbi:MAG: hypothetical protein JNL09_02040 [Anaerolineales bacterium]|nr:hypothetical protein [Anaerolineales bacterium]